MGVEPSRHLAMGIDFHGGGRIRLMGLKAPRDASPRHQTTGNILSCQEVARNPDFTFPLLLLSSSICPFDFVNLQSSPRHLAT